MECCCRAGCWQLNTIFVLYAVFDFLSVNIPFRVDPEVCGYKILENFQKRHGGIRGALKKNAKMFPVPDME